MTTHTINSLTGLGKDELVNAVAADLALEAMSMIRVVTCHDSLVEDGKMTYVTTIRAIRADGRTVGEEEKVGIRGDLVATFSAFETIDMKERLAMDMR